MLPHLGASTAEAEDNCAVMVADQVRDYLESGTVHNSVNFPEMVMPRNGGPRLAIVNANVPHMIERISKGDFRGRHQHPGHAQQIARRYCLHSGGHCRPGGGRGGGANRRYSGSSKRAGAVRSRGRPGDKVKMTFPLPSILRS